MRSKTSLIDDALQAQTGSLAEAAQSSPPFFIVGSGRSGSTLLRMMLVAHSRIVIPPETWFILPLLDRFSADHRLNAVELGHAIDLMMNHYRWPDMRLSAEVLRREAGCLAEPSLKNLIELVYAVHLKASGKVRWGDKTPPYIRIVPKLATLFPGSKFIYLVRDGRDVAKSFQRLRMYGPWLHDNTIEWRDASYWALKWMESGCVDRILQVRYEDLVTAGEVTLRGICDFLGEKFESQMLSWQDEVERLVPAREQHVHRKLKRGTRRQDSGRWKTEMSAREVFVAEAFMYKYLDRHGYVRRFRSPGWIPLFWIARLYCVLLWPSVPFRAIRWIVRAVPRRRAPDPDASGHDEGTARAIKAASTVPVPRAVSWQSRSWRGFCR